MCSTDPLKRYYLYGPWINGISIDNGTGQAISRIETFQGKKVYMSGSATTSYQMAMTDGTCRFYSFSDYGAFDIAKWDTYTKISVPAFGYRVGLAPACRTLVTPTTPLSNTISRYYMYGAWTLGGAANTGTGTPISRIEMIDNKPVFMAEEYFGTDDSIFTKIATLDGINRHYKGTVQDFSESNWDTYNKNDTVAHGVNYRIGLLTTLRNVTATTPCPATLPYYLYGSAVTGTSDTDNGTGIPVVRLEFIDGMPVFIAEEFTNEIMYTKMAMPDGTCKFYYGIAQEFSPEKWAFYTDMPDGSYRVTNYRTCSKMNIITPYTELPVAMREPGKRLYMYGTGIFGDDTDMNCGIPVVQITTEVGATVYVAEDTVNTPTRTKILWLLGNTCKYYDGPASQFSMAAFDSYTSVADNSYRIGVSKFCRDTYGLDLIQANEPCTNGLRRYYLYGKTIDVNGDTRDFGSGLAITSIEPYNGKTYFCAKEFKGGKPIVYIKDVDLGFRIYDNTNNDFTISKWDTLPIPDNDANCKIGIRWDCFSITEIQLRLLNDPLIRRFLGISGRTVEAVNYDAVSNLLFVATLAGTGREILSYDCKNFPATIPTPTSIHIPKDQQVVVRGTFYWKNQTYLLYASRFGRVSALGLEIMAGKQTQASTRTTPYTKNETDMGYNLTFANLSDVCFDTQEGSFYLVDATQNGVYKLSNQGVITSLCSGSANMATLFEDGERNGETCFIPAPTGITLAPDGTLYVSSESFNQVYRIRKTFLADGTEQYLVSIVAGFSATAGTIRTDETAKYSKLNQPRRIRYGTDGALYFIVKRANGADGVARIKPEQYNTFYKGFTGAIQYAPIQVIGNNTTEGNVITLGNTSSAITTEFFAMHIVSDDDGNLYFPDTKTGRILMMDLNNQITQLNSKEQIIPGVYSIAIYKNTMLYLATESATDSKLYSFDLLTKTLTQIPLILEDGRNWQGSIKCLFVKQSGILFIGGFIPNIVSYILIEQPILRIYDLSFIVEDYNTADPRSMCVDNNDNLYVTTTQNLIWKIPLGENASLLFNSGSVQTNILSIIGGKREIFAGNKFLITSTGDGGLATKAGIAKPFGICYSKDDNSLYFTTYGDPTPAPSIRRIDLATNIITTYMGLTRSGYPVHGSTPACSTLISPAGLCRDSQGNLLVLDVLGNDFSRNRTRLAGEGDTRSSLLIKIPSKLFFLQEYVYPLIGTGLQASAPEEGLAVNCKFTSIRGIGADFNGNVYFTSDTTHSVFRYDALKETVTCIAGRSGQSGFSGDGGPAPGATLNTPTFLQVSNDGTVYIFDSGNSCIRRITPFTDGSYQIITFIQTTGPISGLAIDAFENVIYSVVGSRVITVVNQYKAINTLSTNCQVGNLVAQGTTLYFLNLDTNRIEMYSAPYRTKSVYSVALTNTAGPFTIDSNQNIYYTTQAHQIRKVTATIDEAYVGHNGTADFYDGVLPTAGIKDNRHRSIVLLNDPRAIGIDSFDRILFSDQRGNRIRCIPTGIQLNECFVSARYILIESGVSGNEFIFSDFKVFSEKNEVYPAPTNFTNISLRTYLYDLGAMKNVSYIQCKASIPDSIGTKLYLLNENRDILSLRVLSRAAVSDKGETLVYAVPWATSCSFSEFVKIQKDCGIPNVRLIELTNTDVCDNPVIVRPFIKELVVVTRMIDISNNMYTLQTQRFKETDRATFTDKTEILGMFVFRKNTATDKQLEGIQIHVYDSETKQRAPTLTKQIISLTRENVMFEFIDFRNVISEFGCSTLDTIYMRALNMFRIRYIRISRQSDTSSLEVSKVIAISLESGENIAANRFAYTNSSTIYTNLTTGDNNKTVGFFSSPSESWIEIDLGMAAPLEQVIVYPPAGKYYDYDIQCFTETRDVIPIPSKTENFLDTRVAKIRVQGTGYNDAYLQTFGIYSLPAGKSTNSWTEYTRLRNGTFTAFSYWDGYNNQRFTTGDGWYLSLTPYQRDYLEYTFPTPQALAAIRFQNRYDEPKDLPDRIKPWAFRQYGNQLLLYNSTGRLLKRDCIMGHTEGALYSDMDWRGLEHFYLTSPQSVGYMFPSSKLGIKNVRYVRYSNTKLASDSGSKIQIAQLVVLDSQGINRALNKPCNAFSIENLIKTISLQSTRLLWTTNSDYTYFFNKYGDDTYGAKHFYFLYIGRLYRGRLGNAAVLNNGKAVYIEKYIAPNWTEISTSDLPINATTQTPFTIQVLNDTVETITSPFAAVDGSQVPSASKLYRSAGASEKEKFTVDLGNSYEIDSVIYYNSTTNRGWSSGGRIDLLDDTENILASKLLRGGMFRESLDFRPEAETSLRARYVRFENPGILGTGKPPAYDTGSGNLTNPGRLRIANMRLFDIYKRNVAVSKDINVWNVDGTSDSGASPSSEKFNPIQKATSAENEYYVTSSAAGSYWEVDLGQEYSLTELRFKADPNFPNDYRNTTVSLYDDEHRVIQVYWLNNFNSSLGNDYIIYIGQSPIDFGTNTQINTAVSYSNIRTTTNVSGRYVRINGDTLPNIAFQMRQVIVLDDEYRNISLGKPTTANMINVEANSKSYFIVDGRADNNFKFRANTFGNSITTNALLGYFEKAGTDIITIDFTLLSQNRRIQLNVQPRKILFAGNLVKVSKSQITSGEERSFEGNVESYNYDTGILVINNIFNIINRNPIRQRTSPIPTSINAGFIVELKSNSWWTTALSTVDTFNFNTFDTNKWASFTVETNRNFNIGDYVYVNLDLNPQYKFQGNIESYDRTTGLIRINSITNIFYDKTYPSVSGNLVVDKKAITNGNTITIQITEDSNYVIGRKIIVRNTNDLTKSFEGYIRDYNGDSGLITIGSIFNVNGPFEKDLYSFSVSTSENYVEIDLGAVYPISAIMIYGGANIQNIQIFGESRQVTSTGASAVYSIPNDIISIGNTVVPLKIIPLTTVTPFTTTTESSIDMNTLLCCAPKRSGGNMARYVRLCKAMPDWREAWWKPTDPNGYYTHQGFVLSQIVVTDSRGINVALNKPVRSNVDYGWLPRHGYHLVNGIYEPSASNFFLADGPNFGTVTIDGSNYSVGYTKNGEVYIDIDLGDDYFIHDITVYNSTFNNSAYITWSAGIQVDLRDTYQNRTLPTNRFISRPIWDYTLMVETEKYVATFACPPNTQDRNGICIVPCLTKGYEEIDNRCYMPCAENKVILPNSRKQCGRCNTSTHILVNGQCKEFCTGNATLANEKGYVFTDNPDGNTCESKCPLDSDGRPTESIGSVTLLGGTRIDFCRTENYPIGNRGKRPIYDIAPGPKPWDNGGGQFQAWGSDGMWDDWAWWYNGVEVYTTWLNRFNNEMLTDRMRRIYLTTKPGPHTKRITGVIPEDRLSEPIATRSKVQTSSANLSIYDSVGDNLFYLKYNNWSLTTIGNFMRDTTNRAYIKGRYLAQTINLLGRQSNIVLPLSIPPPPPRDCAAGYTINSSGTTCKSNKPDDTWTESGNTYFGPCPPTYSNHPDVQSLCLRDCSYYGSRFGPTNTNLNICIDNCDTGYQDLNGVCVMNCSQQRDSNNKLMQDDTTARKCVTAKPNILNPTWAPNIQKVKIVEPGQPDKYAWIDINWPEWTRRSETPWSNWWEIKPPIELTCNNDWHPLNKDENGLFRLWFDCDKTAGCSNAVEYGTNAFKYILRMDMIKWRSGYSSNWDCNFNRRWIEERKKANPQNSLYDKLMTMFSTGQFAHIEYKDKNQLPKVENASRDSLNKPTIPISYINPI